MTQGIGRPLPEVISSLGGGILTLTLNRPDASNAMTYPMLETLRDQIRFAETCADVRCLVIQGAGNAFCAGGDISSMDILPPGATTVDERIRWQRIMQHEITGRLFKMPKPTLAVVNGAAAGAGLSLALSCDLRVMSTSAFMLTAFANVGLCGDLGAAYFLSRLVNTAKARELLFLSERIYAVEALSIGLANWLCDAEGLLARANAIAKRLAASPAIALGTMKENLNLALSQGLDECLDVEAANHVRCMATSDHLEGKQAFAERRVPVFGLLDRQAGW